MATKTKAKQEPIEVWEGVGGMTGWRWEVLKKNQPKNEDKPYATWFCKVYSPYVPDGEMGDCYVNDNEWDRGIKSVARKVETPQEVS